MIEGLAPLMASMGRKFAPASNAQEADTFMTTHDLVALLNTTFFCTKDDVTEAMIELGYKSDVLDDAFVWLMKEQTGNG